MADAGRWLGRFNPVQRGKILDLNEIFQSVIAGKSTEVETGVGNALAAGFGAEEILNKALIAAMSEVSRRFEAGDFFVPEMLVAAGALQTGLKLLKPYLAQADIQAIGKIPIRTVKGDLHDIGMPAMLTTTMTNMQATVEALKSAGLRKKVKVIIGGAPVTKEYANKIGVDGFASDASGATRTALELLQNTGI